MNELKLHDIKPLLEIPDNSFFIYLAIIFSASLLLLVLIFFIIKYFKNKKENIEKEYLKKLHNLDLNQTKNCAYLITKYGRVLVKSPREKKILHELIEDLESYKYKKDVDSFDNKTKAKIENFLDVLDVK